MVKFNCLLASANSTDFKFISQTRVSLCTLYCNRVVSYSLTKEDVITSIRYYLSCIHSLYCQSVVKDLPSKVRCESMNFKVLKMYDLVPYLYTLINYYLTLRIDGIVGYNRRLPELKITRFCHLPFEHEIVPPVDLPELVVKCAYLPVANSAISCFVALISGCHPICYFSIEALRDKLQSLYPMHRVILKVVGS